MQDYQLDLHTHSIISYDGGITDAEYARIFSDPPAGGKNVVAVTDHNEISKAQELHKIYGEQVIIGEEILTLEGEIIGLFLTQKIEPKLSLEEAIQKIKAQSGLVYIPHPLETSRKGLQLEALMRIISSVDVIEVFNARLRSSFLPARISALGQKYKIAATASSDAHGLGGFGSAFSEISAVPTRENLLSLLSNAKLTKNRAPMFSFLHPLRNKLKKKLKL